MAEGTGSAASAGAGQGSEATGPSGGGQGMDGAEPEVIREQGTSRGASPGENINTVREKDNAAVARMQANLTELQNRVPGTDLTKDSAERMVEADLADLQAISNPKVRRYADTIIKESHDTSPAYADELKAQTQALVFGEAAKTLRDPPMDLQKEAIAAGHNDKAQANARTSDAEPNSIEQDVSREPAIKPMMSELAAQQQDIAVYLIQRNHEDLSAAIANSLPEDEAQRFVEHDVNAMRAIVDPAKRIDMGVLLTHNAARHASYTDELDRQAPDIMKEIVDAAIKVERERASPKAERDGAPEQASAPSSASSASKTAKPDVESEDEFVPPEALRKRYLHARGEYHFRGGEGGLAFVDRGNALHTSVNDADVARDMVLLAASKGWTDLRIKGSDEFKREAWLAAEVHGLRTKGFEPQDVDHARLKEFRDAQAQSVKSFARDTDKGPSPSDDQAQERKATRKPRQPKEQTTARDPNRLTRAESVAIEGLKAMQKARGDTPEQIAATVQAAKEEFAKNPRHRTPILRQYDPKAPEPAPRAPKQATRQHQARVR